MLTIQRSGTAPELDWLTQRLSSQAWQVEPGPPPAGLAHWSGLQLGGLYLDIDAGLHWHHQTRAAQLQALGLDYLEFTGPWQPLAAEWGFILFVGGAEPALQSARPLLDALAPLPGAWLHCGPVGAASFTAAVFAALGQPLASLPPLDPQRSPHDILDWPVLLAKQLDTARRLGQLADDYLAGQGLTMETSPAEPAPHYAAWLARLLHAFAASLEQLSQS